MKFTIFKFLGLASILHGVVAKQQPTTTSLTTTISTKKVARTFLPRGSSSKATSSPLDLRGGACSDSDPVLFLKLGTTGVFESAALFGILYSSVLLAASSKYPDWIPSILNEPLISLLASMLVVFGSSFVGAIVEGGMSSATNQALKANEIPGDANWYSKLKKPSWTPPGYVFPIMWLIVSKPTQLCALSRMIKFGLGSDTPGTLFALAVYTSHLALGDAWNKVFFGLECIGRGTFVISLFYGALLASAYLFYNIDKGAGYYMLPTCAWVTVATALQYSIYFKNKK